MTYKVPLDTSWPLALLPFPIGFIGAELADRRWPSHLFDVPKVDLNGHVVPAAGESLP